MNSRINLNDYGTVESDEHLHWHKGKAEKVLEAKIFDVYQVEQSRDDGRKGNFVQINCADWVNVCAIHPNSAGEPCLVMVRQYRQGNGRVSLEMPGGMIDAGEDPGKAGARELLEETGFSAGSIELLGSTCPNAAFMANTLYCYLARNLTFEGVRELDENEVIDVELVPIKLLAEGKVPEFTVNGIMTVGWYFFSIWLRDNPPS